MKKNHFNIRIQLTEKTISVLDVFFDSIEYFASSNPNIVLELYLWCNKNVVDHDKIMKMCKIKSIALHEKPLLYIPFFCDLSTRENYYSCKFKIYYEDSNSFINCIFQFYSLVKASSNKEDARENRNDRKQTFYRKTKNRRARLDDKKNKR